MTEVQPPAATSSADEVPEPGIIERIFDKVAEEIDQVVPWYRLPKPLGLVELVGIRNTLRRENLVDTTRLPASGAVEAPAYNPRYETERSPDGSWNDLVHPEMGMAKTRFGRNVPLDRTWPDGDRMMRPNPRAVSRDLMTRGELIPAAAGNVLITAWLQFMIRDWFKHGPGSADDPWVLPPVAGDDWPDPPLTVPRTPADPTMPPDFAYPPTYLNINTHWWDGSSLYGNDLSQQRFRRTGSDGKLRVEGGLVPVAGDPVGDRTRVPGFWLGMAMLETLFAQEHNSICDMLHGAYPGADDEALFQRARLIVAGLLAKIHTVEWTPAVTAHPTAVAALNANWWGLAGKRLREAFGRVVDNEEISGIPGSETADYGVPYALTEEFVAVYRMHQLVPDDFDFRAAADDSPTLGRVSFRDLAGPKGAEVLAANRLGDLIYSFGTMNPGLVCLHNFPRFLQEFERPDGKLMDLAATDILRCRELGVPRYAEFRRLLHLPVPTSFDDITSNKEWAAELSATYDGVVEDVDLIPGMLAEDFPEGFAFSDTAFRIFVLMASRRLNSDRFFTTHFTDEVYTREGMQWLQDNTMGSVLARHCPELKPYLGQVANAFAIWPRPEATSRPE